MAENKTKITGESVKGYISKIEDKSRQKDCKVLTKLMTAATHQEPKMWGTSIVGFGSYHYKYASGREGDSCLTGFSSRKKDITIYLVERFPGKVDLLSKLGKYKLGTGCLYIHQLSDIDPDILAQIVAGASAERQRIYS
jgi:hypothetical protein